MIEVLLQNDTEIIDILVKARFMVVSASIP